MSWCDHQNDIDELILVIHGVGDPAPGETLSLFARSIADRKTPLVEKSEVLWLEDRTDNVDRIDSFETHIRTLKIENQNSVLAEVFWGDLSRVRKGILGAAIGLVEVLFGLRYVAYVAAYQPGWGALVLRRLGLLCTSILQGPVLAITAFLGLLTLVLTVTQVIWPDSHGVLWTRIVMCGAVGISLSIGSLGFRLSQNVGVKGFWFWFQVVAAFISGLMVFKTLWMDPHYPSMVFSGPVKDGLVWYCGVLVTMLALLWLVQMLNVIALGVSWGIAILSPSKNRTGLHVAFLLPALAVGFWGLALPSLWLTAANSLERFVKLEEFNHLFEKAVPLLGVQFVMAILVMAAASVVMLRYVRWRAANLRAKAENLTEPPRLIVHSALQFVIAFTTLAGVSMVATISLLQFSGFENNQIAGAYLLSEANNFATAILLPAGLIGLMVFPHLRPVLDIVLDVMNHFFFRGTQVGDLLDNDEFDIHEATIEAGTFYFARRDAIHLRIKKTLTYFREQYGNRPELTIISHSQGTMIAIEILNDPELAWLNSSFSRVRLVTMGSPFRHLYQHYFSHLYPALHDAYWNELRSRLDRWINIFRRDDFVGTQLDFGELVTRFPGKFSNHPVGLRGHLNYWCGRDVLEILHQELVRVRTETNSDRRRVA